MTSRTYSLSHLAQTHTVTIDEPEDQVDRTSGIAFVPAKIVQMVYRSETPKMVGSLIVLDSNGRIFEQYDGSTAWNEVEGPKVAV